MKKKFSNQLEGVHIVDFQKATFEEIAEKNKQYGMEMFKAEDQSQLDDVHKM